MHHGKGGSLSAFQNTQLSNQQHTYVTIFLSPKVTLKRYNTNIQQHIAQTAVSIENTINTTIMLQNKSPLYKIMQFQAKQTKKICIISI